MTSSRLVTLCFLALALLAFAACGGGGTTLDASGLEEPAAIVSESDDKGWSGLPAVPLEEEQDKAAAEAEDPGPEPGFRTVLGKDYIQMQGGYVEGNALVLDNYPEIDPEDIDPEQFELTYGMYKLSGLRGLRPLSLNIECLPGGLGEGYFVGLADYTKGVWKWFGPVGLPEAEIDLRGQTHQFVTHLGNLYFLIVVPPGNSATHYRSTLIAGPADPGTMPGLPHHLVASDGQFPEKVVLSWVGGVGAAQYQVFRRAAWGENVEWRMIGETQETRYVDQPLPDYKMFYYRVRGANAAGESHWSNVDSGFAGGGDDPCVIKGDITTVMGEPVPGIHVGLVGLDEQMVRITDEQGRFYFGDLPPGKYIVAPRHPELVFAPPFHAVNLTEQKLADVHFNAMLEWSFHRVWGFAFTFAEAEEGPRFEPLEGVYIQSKQVGDPTVTFDTYTDEHGFWLLEDLPVGVHIVTAELQGMHFIPNLHEVVVNGHNRPDRRDFLGVPIPSDPGDPE